jgi:CubicO group peptidase (beta-lactamase class C family)
MVKSMFKKSACIIFVGLVLFCLYEYLSAPVFWKRFVAMLTSSGKGAYSSVFEPTEAVRQAERVFAIPVASLEERTISNDALKKVTAYAADFDSFALIVVHKGKVQLEWYAEGYDRDSLTQSQSMHKSLQAFLIGVALEEGLIGSIDDSIGDYIEELAGDSRGRVSIYNYLIMASGLENFSANFSPWSEAFRWLFDDDTVTATLSYPQVRPAGQAFDYNDLNAQTLGILLSRVTGKRYVDYLYEKLWNPMGGQAARVWLDHEGGEVMHNCCLLAPAMDWARIGLVMLHEGEINGRRLVSADWIRRMRTPSKLSPHYGLQTWIASNEHLNERASAGGYRRTEKWLADDIYYFSGYGAQRVYVSNAKELVVVRLGPAAGYFPRIIEEWDNTFIVNTLIRGM